MNYVLRLCLLFFLVTTGPIAVAGVLPGTLQSIPTTDGYTLEAYVAVPSGPGSGPFPLVVMPSSWGISFVEYVGQANALANQGYIVVSYSSRGFSTGCALRPTCGLIDVAGPLTVGDVSTVIDWALAHTQADPQAIGVSGISYGAGTSLLAAASDPRIKAVASLSTWANLEASLDANQTPSAQGIALLSYASYLGKPGPLMQQINQDVVFGNYAGAVGLLLPVVAVRDPATQIAQLNANGPAVLLANAFEDSLFVPSQLIDFYDQLQVPKRLMLAHGDHATNELLGAQGLPNEVYDTVTQWFDRYLKGVANGVDSQPPVQLKSQMGDWSTYPDWAAVQQGATTYALTDPSVSLFNPTGTGRLTPAAGGSWKTTIMGGIPTVANSGVVMINGVLTGLSLPLPTSLPLIARTNATVWTGPVLTTTRHLAGMPALHVTVTSDQSALSLFAYLYSVDPLFGTAQLITHKPYTFLQVTPGVPQTLDLRLEATDWQVNAGQQLALVIGTVDGRYAGVTPLFSRVTLSSPTSSPSTLTVTWH
ncbi:alpha/beta fold hydrolase [Dyella subtropica]|uniref:alpha/beta fold hydrolase n=1 Tax=Dyella subtropica TaxID=2992127 RepID=UPI00225A4D0C|nr:alpha/beta fold hydrolase [Dyella subtropica]